MYSDKYFYGITDLIPNMIEAIKKETEKKMQLFGSVNKA